MSSTLADVEAYQVYRDKDGDIVWRDAGHIVLCRRFDGRIKSLGPVRPDLIAIVGDPLGHVRDDPWRKADAGSLADAHNRIDALQARLDALEQRPSAPVEPVNQCNAPPAPKWHPVSEPVPDMEARYHAGSLTYGNKFENQNIVVGWQVRHHPYGYTHWCGPIEPPPFKEKP